MKPTRQPSFSTPEPINKLRALTAQCSAYLELLLAKSLLLLTLVLSSNAVALEFQCEIPNDIRHIRVDMPGEEYLCEVSVTYKESGVREVKWYAQNDSMFCSAKAYDLRDKYEELWDYTCTDWPDRDGIDKLSPAQRLILDQRLKVHIAKGLESTPQYSIKAIRAVASTPLDNQPGKLALQFFTDDGDFTEIINDQNDNWNVDTTIDQMTSQINSGLPLNSALVHAISDEGSIEVRTQLTNETESECFGHQIISVMGDGDLVEPRTPHRFVCQGYDPEQNAMNEAAPALSESLLTR